MGAYICRLSLDLKGAFMDSIIYQKNEFPLIEWYIYHQEAENVVKEGEIDKALNNLKTISLSQICFVSVHVFDQQTLKIFLTAFRNSSLKNIYLFLNIAPSLAKVYLELKPEKEEKLNISFNCSDIEASAAEVVDSYLSNGAEGAEIMQYVDSFTLTFGNSFISKAYDVAMWLYENTQKKVILSPSISIYGDRESLSWKQLDAYYMEVLNKLKDANLHNKILIKRGILPLSLLVEHPCNSYMCAGHTCHSGKGDNPRKFVIDCYGEVYPISSALPREHAIGNIYSEAWFEMVTNPSYVKKHELFKMTCKSVFNKWLQHCPLAVVPWDDLYEYEAKQG